MYCVYMVLAACWGFLLDKQLPLKMIVDKESSCSDPRAAALK